jgi:hypothetical protein
MISPRNPRSYTTRAHGRLRTPTRLSHPGLDRIALPREPVLEPGPQTILGGVLDHLLQLFLIL